MVLKLTEKFNKKPIYFFVGHNIDRVGRELNVELNNKKSTSSDNIEIGPVVRLMQKWINMFYSQQSLQAGVNLESKRVEHFL